MGKLCSFIPQGRGLLAFTTTGGSPLGLSQTAQPLFLGSGSSHSGTCSFLQDSSRSQSLSSPLAQMIQQQQGPQRCTQAILSPQLPGSAYHCLIYFLHSIYNISVSACIIYLFIFWLLLYSYSVSFLRIATIDCFKLTLLCLAISWSRVGA